MAPDKQKDAPVITGPEGSLHEDADMARQRILAESRGLREQLRGEIKTPEHIDGFLKDFRERQADSAKLETELTRAETGDSVWELQSKMEYSRLASLFLKTDADNSFTVDLQGKGKFELFIGLGHMLPPSVQMVRVTDLEGSARIGTRKTEGNKIGYYDENGYLPVFSGYRVEVVETIDEKGDQYNEFMKAEREFYSDRRRLTSNSSWHEDTLEEMVARRDGETENPETEKYRTDWEKMVELLAGSQVKVDIDTLLFDGPILRSLDGNGHELLDGKTVSLIETLGISGYEFRLADLRFLNGLANNQERLQAVEQKIAESGETMTFETVERMATEGQGATPLQETKNIPRFARRIAENGRPFRTPTDYLRYFRSRSEVSIGVINPDQYGEGTFLGRLQCARYVSDVLGLTQQTGWTQSAPALFSNLVRSGGQIISEPRELQAGDVLFQRGTYDNLWNGISHVAVVIGRSNSTITIRHHSGRARGVVTTTYAETDPKFDKKFYAGVRHSQIVAQRKVFERARAA